MNAKKKPTADTPAAMDETKRKFREALDAKHHRESEGEAHLDDGSSEAHGHGPVDPKRTFRRKTG